MREFSFHDEFIDRRIEIHDANHFEVKLDYSISQQTKADTYLVEVFFFVPKSLGINSHTYTAQQFYSDIQAYIRFKTPVIYLKALADPDNERSPLVRIGTHLEQLLQNPKDRERARWLVCEMQLLGCLVRANLRDWTTALSEKIEALRGHVETSVAQLQDAQGGCAALLYDMRVILGGFRALRATFQHPHMQARGRDTYAFVDEYLSLMAENALTRLVSKLDEDKSVRTALSGVRTDLCARVVAEREHRASAGYRSVLGGSANEFFVYRRGLLKKFVMSVLFLDINKEREGQGILNAVAAVAAGLAMLFATVSSLWTQSRFGINSVPFVAVLIVSYMLKDRIKDWLKAYFSQKMTRWIPDHNLKIKNPLTQSIIGSCREAFSFIGREAVPPEVWAYRHQASGVIEIESKPEVVMKYEKQIQLRSEKIPYLSEPLNDINDIIRFNISTLLARTDDPLQSVRTYDEAQDQVVPVSCPKVYHLNVVFVLKSQHAPDRPVLERVRVVLDKTGIRRLERVRPRAADLS